MTLSIGATEATAAKTYGLYYPSLDAAQVQPLSMLAYAAANAWYVLAQRPEVDSDRIGIVGHSFGGKWAMFASCLFDKYSCAAWSDPGIVFDERPIRVVGTVDIAAREVQSIRCTVGGIPGHPFLPASIGHVDDAGYFELDAVPAGHVRIQWYPSEQTLDTKPGMTYHVRITDDGMVEIEE